ncbi:unnamed protein product [Camellia sinensis]
MNGPRAVCILSANGGMSNVTLRQVATSGGTATYERLVGQRSRTGGLSVTLARPDGCVLGGCVAGLLTAATPVQMSVPSKLFLVGGGGGGGGATGATSPPSHGLLSESSGGPGSPLNHSTGAYNNSNPQGMLTMPWR